MRLKIGLLLTGLLMMIIGISHAQEGVVLPPSASQVVVLQRAIEGEWKGNDSAGTLTLISQNPRTQVVVKYPQLTGGVYDTAQFNSAWAEFGGEVEAVLDTATYNVRLMLSAPVTDDDVVEYEARVLEFVDVAGEERELDKTFDDSRLTLLPNADFMSAVAGIDVEAVAPEEEGMIFVSHVYVQVGTEAVYDAESQTLTLTGLNSGVFRIADMVSVLRGESLFSRWGLVPDVSEARYEGMLAYADSAVSFSMSLPVYDVDSESLSVSVSLAEGVTLPEQVELPTLVILTDIFLDEALQVILTEQTSGIRSDACAQATARYNDALAAYQEAQRITNNTMNTTFNGTNTVTTVDNTLYGMERISNELAQAGNYKDQVCGASGPPMDFP